MALRTHSNKPLIDLLVTAAALLGCISAAYADTLSTPVQQAAPEEVRTVKTKIRIRVADTELKAILANNPVANDFASLLPLKLKMKDLFRREKFGHLPRALSEGGERVFTYKIGEIIYWPPGPDVAIYYRDDGKKIPKPGIVVLGHIEAGTQILDVAGNVDVVIERIE